MESKGPRDWAQPSSRAGSPQGPPLRAELRAQEQGPAAAGVAESGAPPAAKARLPAASPPTAPTASCTRASHLPPRDAMGLQSPGVDGRRFSAWCSLRYRQDSGMGGGAGAGREFGASGKRSDRMKGSQKQKREGRGVCLHHSRSRGTCPQPPTFPWGRHRARKRGWV